MTIPTRLEPPFKNLIKREQTKDEDKIGFGHSKPEGTMICIECRKDTPVEKLTEYDHQLGIRGQLCKPCYDDLKHRIQMHARRIKANLERGDDETRQ